MKTAGLSQLPRPRGARPGVLFSRRIHDPSSSILAWQDARARRVEPRRTTAVDAPKKYRPDSDATRPRIRGRSRPRPRPGLSHGSAGTGSGRPPRPSPPAAAGHGHVPAARAWTGSPRVVHTNTPAKFWLARPSHMIYLGRRASCDRIAGGRCRRIPAAIRPGPLRIPFLSSSPRLIAGYRRIVGVRLYEDRARACLLGDDGLARACKSRFLWVDWI